MWISALQPATPHQPRSDHTFFQAPLEGQYFVQHADVEQPNTPGPLAPQGTTRYQSCMRVDEESLRSVPEKRSDWHVNIIKRRWRSTSETDDQSEDFDGDFEEEDELPPLEGCIDQDVGWAKLGLSVLVGLLLHSEQSEQLAHFL